MIEQIRLEYHRPPDRTDSFVQELVYESEHVIVTFLAHTPLQRVLVIDDKIALEPNAPVVWFTFPGVMHDIGRFHTAAGDFTGLYANILTPVEMRSRTDWRTTDLFVDVWLGQGGHPRLLDAAELDHALACGWIDEPTAHDALSEAERLLDLYGKGTWPPAIVNEWPLERVLNKS